MTGMAVEPPGLSEQSSMETSSTMETTSEVTGPGSIDEDSEMEGIEEGHQIKEPEPELISDATFQPKKEKISKISKLMKLKQAKAVKKMLGKVKGHPHLKAIKKGLQGADQHKLQKMQKQMLKMQEIHRKEMAKMQENHRTEMVEKERIIHNQQTTIEQQKAIIEMHEHRQMSMGVVEKKEEEEDWFSCLFNNNVDESQRASGASSPRGRCTPTPAHQGWTAAPSP